MKEKEKTTQETLFLEEETENMELNNEENQDLEDKETSQEKFSRLEEEVKQYKEKYLHQLAEMENTRKRLQKERSDMLKFSVENLLFEFLSPLDHFENALGFAKEMPDEIKNWAMGFQMILTQFKDILNNQGVSSYESKGEKFDPHLHEAVEIEETNEFEEGTIIQEFVRGYKCKDRVLRPARVKVAKKIQKNSEEKNINKEKPNERAKEEEQ